MTLTKDHIIKSVQKHFDLTKSQSADMIESVLEIIKKTLAEGDDVLISGFGKFCVREKKERRGRNPATGKDLMLGARRVVTFRCSSLLRDKLNGKQM